ncbi:hypothetical protein F4859DRAFT_512922 [Xylaria cf. heliscus]|nr:hypothetical protein F4859DRAFT_512922 [Xylaria cf. heliscus]
MGIIPILEAREHEASTGDNGRLMYIPSWVFMFVCPIFVGMRLWSRKKTDGGLGADDYTILASLAFAIATYAVSIWGCGNGYGKHSISLTGNQLVDSYESFYLAQITYKVSLNLTKSSILLLYLRVFGGVKWFRRTCYILLAIVALYCTVSTLVSIFQCIPIRASFDKSIARKTCIRIGPFWYTNSVFSIVTDIIILIIPMPIIYGLQMRIYDKAVLMGAFAAGFCVVITTIFRITTVHSTARHRDPLYDVAPVMWTIIEMSTAIMCACLPQLRGFFAKVICPGVNTVHYNLKYKLGCVKPDINHQQTSEEEERKWAQIGPQNGIELSNTTCEGDTGSEIPSGYEGRDRRTKILKTVGYSLEYSMSAVSS